MIDSLDISEKLRERYEIRISPEAIENWEYEQKQTLGQLFMKSDWLYRFVLATTFTTPGEGVG